MKNPVIKLTYTLITLLMIVLNGAEVFASAPWTANPGDYRYDMSLYLDFSFVAEKMDYSKYEVAAFCGDQCRGIAEVLPLDNGNECLYLRARSNQVSGETMTFKYYNKETQEVRPVDDVSFPFEADSRIGYPSEPYEVTVIVHFDVNLTAGDGGTIDNTGGRFVEGTELTVVATPSEGYHFERWSDGDTNNPRSFVVEDDITLTAEFGVNSYKLTYVVDGEIYKEYIIDYAAAIIPEAIPEKEGYSFSGWEELPGTMPARDVEVGGTFSVNLYLLTVYLDDNLYIEEWLEFGTPLNIAEPEVPEGKFFVGWDKEIPAAMPAYDLEIHGKTSEISSIRTIYTGANVKLTVYDLRGVLLLNNVFVKDAVGSLDPGLYIVNGRKMVIRQ